MKVATRYRDRGDDFRHGTPSGYNRHRNAGEQPCESCRAAKSDYDRRNLSAPRKQRLNRLHAKAQNLALKDLKDAHLDEYRAAYQRHKVELLRDLVRDEDQS